MAYPPVTLLQGQQVEYTMAPVDGQGRPKVIDSGSFKVTSDNAAVASQLTGLGGSPTVIRSQGPIGSANLTFSATFGGIALTEVVPVTVTADPAVTFGLAFKPPTF